MNYYLAWVTIEQKYDILDRSIPWYLRPFKNWWVKV